ncbi:MAG: orotidine-5'-phosphate decarboxylase [Gemmatimonadota bacterium]|nr:orotidine-5'-phosphate decarboxylase [Gemmatimonadota bacterium]
MRGASEVIIALDTPSLEEALGVIDVLGDEARFYKVGLELYTRVGPRAVAEVIARKKRVFLDLKLHDIPNTVARAARAISELGVDLLTVHAAGGAKMIEAAREGLDSGTGLLAVTVLTSMAAEDLGATWGRQIESIPEEVVRLAELARVSGADGVVSAASDAAQVRAGVGDEFLIVVPGIRPAGADHQDQKRVATPAHAVRAGADYLVIGRAVTQAPDPAGALRAMVAEMDLSL